MQPSPHQCIERGFGGLTTPVHRKKDLQRKLGQKETSKLCEVNLVGGFNPFEKYARQIGSFLQVGVKIKKN